MSIIDEKWIDPAEKLAELQEGEEPYEDERVVPTPAQWIWKWNRVTAAERLEAAEIVIEARDHQRESFMQKWPERAREAEARIAAIRAALVELEAENAENGYGGYGDGLWQATSQVRAALDGPAEQPTVPPQLSPASIVAPEPVQLPPLAAMLELAQRARAAQQVEQRHLEEAIYWRATLAGLDVHWATSGVQQVAGHQTALARLTASPFYPPPAVEPSGADPLCPGLPLVPDDTLPPGEVHLRPHPRTAEQPIGHDYLSTGCLHGEHGYCQGSTGAVGAKAPAQCKFCATPCTCGCHTVGEAGG